MTDILKITPTTSAKSPMHDTADSFSNSALAWINNHEDGTTESILDDESQKHIVEIDAVWAALDGLAEDDFVELKPDIKPVSVPVLELQQKPQDKIVSMGAFLGQPRYWGAIAAMLFIALLLPLNYVGISTDYMVAKGQRDTVMLSDGSRIELGSNTRVSVREGWGQRTVTLEQGNAFFSVTPNKNKPFVIHAGTSTVTVLGTAFGVYRKQKHVEVVVESGKVNLMDASSLNHTPVNIDLVKNQKITIRHGYASKVLNNVNVDDAIAWRRGFINFKQASLSTIVERMNDYYDIPIYIRNNKRRELVLSGVFKTDDLDSFLVGLQAIADVNVEHNPGGAIYLY